MLTICDKKEYFLTKLTAILLFTATVCKYETIFLQIKLLLRSNWGIHTIFAIEKVPENGTSEGPDNTLNATWWYDLNL